MSLEPPGTEESTVATPPAPEPDTAAVAQERMDMAGVVGSPWGRALRLGLLVAAIVWLGVAQGLSMLIVVAAIVIMIFLHELGHYIMAKRAGMLVTEFFLGFGPKIWSFQRGETEYGVKAIPAGAYVKIIGMSNMEEVDPALESRTYRQKSFSQRVGVAVAGSTMHFLIAGVLLFVQFAFIGDPTTDRWSIGDVTPGSAADVAGLQEGDEILSLDGNQVGTFETFREVVAEAQPGQVDMEVVRDGEQVVVPISLSRRMKLIGTIREDVDVVDNGDRIVVGDPYADGAAEAAGLVGGSTLTEVNGEPVTTLTQVTAAAAGSADGVVVLTTADEQGTTSEHRIDLGSDLGTTAPGAFVGVGPQPVLVPEGPIGAVAGAGRTFGSIAAVSVGGVAKFIWPPNLIGFIGNTVTGSSDQDAASTPTEASQTPTTASSNRPISIIGVAMLGSDLTSENLSSLVMFLASLNIFIGVFNLFPMLPFDGGHVVIAFYEKSQELRRRTTQRYLADVSRLLPVAYGVVAVLVVVGALAMFLDITRGVSL
jgi:RIP metalloprotease RseP